MKTTQRFEIKCPECGHTEFEQPFDMQDDDFVKCHQCDFEIMVSDIREIGIQQARDEVVPQLQKEFQKALKGIFKG